jgi:hypothetical protein
MKAIYSTIFAILVSLTAVQSFAQVQVNTSGLTDTQKAELVKVAEQMRANSSGAQAIVDNVDKWVDVGERFGKMLGGAAKEVGIAVNDFVKTPVGMMTAGLIVWSYMGSMIVHVVVGLLLFVVGISILSFFHLRATRMEVKYDTTAPRNWFGQYPVIGKTRERLDTDSSIAYLFGYFVTAIVSLFVIFSW